LNNQIKKYALAFKRVSFINTNLQSKLLAIINGKTNTVPNKLKIVIAIIKKLLGLRSFGFLNKMINSNELRMKLNMSINIKTRAK